MRTGDGKPRRLFVAVWPPDDVLDRIVALDRPAVPGLRWTGRDQWHVTVRFLGEVADVAPVVEALDCVDVPAVTAVLGPAVDRFGQRVLHVPVAGLDELAGAVAVATSDRGRAPEDRPFAGHLTLARVARRATVDLRALAGPRVEGRWTVSGFDLVHSRPTPTGRRYEVLERFGP